VSIFYNRKINIKAVTKSKGMDHQINSQRTPGQPTAHGTPQIFLSYAGMNLAKHQSTHTQAFL
jgi:hypothetical protein